LDTQQVRLKGEPLSMCRSLLPTISVMESEEEKKIIRFT
jgi:hypothetical protein